MTELPPDLDREKDKKSRVKTEREYIDMCVQYAQSTGWVKGTDVDVLIDKYLRPIYKKYSEIISDLQRDKVPENELAKIILRMNNCLEATKRIGSTDPNNIIKSVEDSRNRARDVNTEYALTSLFDLISAVVHN